MMNDNEARQALKNIVKTYLKKAPEIDRLLEVIDDKSRPGLPVRGVLESMRNYREQEYSEQDKEIIEELIYLFG